jgi:hypothetical protein
LRQGARRSNRRLHVILSLSKAAAARNKCERHEKQRFESKAWVHVGSFARSPRVPLSECELRRERDSNPRYDFTPYNGLANRRLQPLGHLSALH